MKASISGRISRRTRTTSTIGSIAFGTRQRREAALAACQGHPLAKVSEEKKSSSQVSPRLYDLTTLQREANNRFGLSARRTLAYRAGTLRAPQNDYLSADRFARVCRRITSPPARQTSRQTSRRPCETRPNRCSTTAGCGRTSASSTTRKSPITSPSSRPAPQPSPSR